jgi:hypothetical protein
MTSVRKSKRQDFLTDLKKPAGFFTFPQARPRSNNQRGGPNQTIKVGQIKWTKSDGDRGRSGNRAVLPRRVVAVNISCFQMQDQLLPSCDNRAATGHPPPCDGLEFVPGPFYFETKLRVPEILKISRNCWVNMSVEHLASPQNLTPPAAVYVVWL